MDWINVSDRPLFTINDKEWWECTDDGDKAFMAAVPYVDKKDPGKINWWIHHCVIEEGIGLCVVGDDDNTPAGWDMKDVEWYFHIPEPPKTIQ